MKILNLLIFFSKLLQILPFYTESNNIVSQTLSQTNPFYSDFYCDSYSSTTGLCTACDSQSNPYAFFIANVNDRCIYNSNDFQNYYYNSHLTLPQAYAVNPYCQINDNKDLSQNNQPVVTVTSSSFILNCASCYTLYTPKNVQYTFSPTSYQYETSNTKIYCVADCREVPYASISSCKSHQSSTTGPCDSNCLDCLEPNCMECGYNKIRYGNLESSMTTNNPPSYIKNVVNGQLSCTTAGTRTTLTNSLGDFYISSTESACASSLWSSYTCDGSYANPFETLTSLFIYLQRTKKIGEYKEVTMNIYLMKGGSHYVLDKYVPATGNPFQFTFMKSDESTTYYQDELMLRAFERVSVVVTISPAYYSATGTCNSATSCFQSGEQATIIWKSHLTSFWISKQLTFSNIIMDGSDMFPFTVQSGNSMGNTNYNDYVFKKSQCCSCDSNGVCTQNGNNNCFCGTSSTQQIPNPISSQEYFNYNNVQNTASNLYHWPKRPFGIFNMEFLSDYSGVAIPQLIIQGCTFKNFRFHQYSPTFIAVAQNYASFITISSSTFLNFFHPYGLISNSYVPWMRDIPYYIPSKPQLCTDKSLTEPCYYLLIDSTIFNISTKNASYVKWDPQPQATGGQSYPELVNEVENEGIVLFLNNFNGPITILSSQFLNLVTMMDTSCEEEEETMDENDFSQNPQSSIFIDDLMKRRIENCNSDNQFTGSILNIRNLKLGLTIKDCIFEDNVGFTGTALFLHQFDIYGYGSSTSDNTKASVILIENNLFHRNMACRFGLNIVIINYANDYLTIANTNKCSGIQLNSNTFQDNVGCLKSFGNVVISCYPTTVGNMNPPYQTTNYESSNNEPTSTTYNIAYQFGISAPQNLNSNNDYTLWFRNLLDKVLSTTISSNNYTLNVPPLPETVTTTRSIDLSTINIYDNVFINNYAIISNGLYVSGAPQVNINNNTFKNNAIPIAGSTIYNITGYATNINNNYIYYFDQIFYESSTLIVSLSLIVTIQNCIFVNNSARLYQNPYYGLAITLNKILPANSVLIKNCSFSTLNTDAILPYLYKNSLPIISLGYLEYFGFTYTTTQGSSWSYSQNYKSNFTITSCSFTDINFDTIPYSTSIDFNYGSVISFFSDVATNTGINNNIKGYTSINLNSPSNDFQFFISNTSFSNIDINDGRPLIPLFFNNIVSINNLTMNFVTINENSIWGSYGGFIVLYLITNSFDFSYKNYQISINNISFSNCQGIVINIRHPLEIRSPSLTTVMTGFLNITNIIIISHITLNAIFIFDQINALNLYNIEIQTASTFNGIFFFAVEQQCPSSCGQCPSDYCDIYSVLYITNITASYITSYVSAGLYLNSLINAKFTNITLQNITFVFSDASFNSASSVNLGICLYITDSLPYISNFSCVNIVISSTTSKSIAALISSSSSLAVCFSFISVQSYFLPMTLFTCSISKGNIIFPSGSFPLYLGYMNNNLNVLIKNSIFSQHISLYDSLYVYASENIVLTNITFYQNQIHSSLGNLALNILELSYLLLSSSFITNNYCDNCSASIGISMSSKFEVDSSIISGNVASDTAGIWIEGSSMLIMQNVTMSGNTGTAGSGMITSSQSTLTISFCTFEDNYMYVNGMKLVDTYLDLIASYFKRNYALSKSSNIYLSVNSVQSMIWDCWFENPAGFFNSSKALSSQKGHFVFVNDANLLIEYSTFINGYSSIGGAIYFTSSSRSIVLQNCNFINNTADEYGGALYLDGSSLIQFSSFNNNSCKAIGSNIYISSGEFINVSGTFFNNTIEISVYLDQLSSMNIDGSTFQGAGSFPTNGITCNLCSMINISNTIFSNFNNTNGNGAAVILLGLTTGDNYDDSNFIELIMTDSEVKYCIANEGPALFVVGNVQANLSSDTFDYNYASYDNSDDYSGKGGAIFFNCTNLYCAVQFIQNNKFSHNRADIAGGAHYFSEMPYIFFDTSTTYYNNSATYGNNQAAYPVSIEFYDEVSSESILSTYFSSDRRLQSLPLLPEIYSVLTSGSVITPIPVMQILDEYGQVVSSDNSSILSAKSFDGTVTFGNFSQFTAFQGYYIIYPFSVLFTPGATASIYFSSSAISSKFQRTDLNFVPNLNFSQNLRQCLQGEKRSDTDACYVCDSGTYSTYDFSNTSYTGTVSCITCPSSGLCNGVYLYGPAPGYWKYDSYSNTLFGCYNGDACLGAQGVGNESLNCKEVADIDKDFCYTGWCSEGYQGTMCEDCADGWAQADPLKKTCIKCNNNPGYYVKSLFLSFLAIAFIVWTVWNKIQTSKRKSKQDLKQNLELVAKINQVVDENIIKPLDCESQEPEKSSPNAFIQSQLKIDVIEEQEHDENDKKSDMSEGSDLSKSPKTKFVENNENPDVVIKDRSSVYVKVLFNYIQILAILGNFPFNWPSALWGLFSNNKQAVSSSQSFFSIDCFLKQDVFAEIGLRVFFTKLMLYAMSPIGFLAIAYVVWLVIFYAKYKSNMRAKKEEFLTNVITTMVVLLFMIHPNIIQQDFDAFSCTDLNDSTYLGYSSLSQDLGKKYVLNVDNQIKCWDDYHLKWCIELAMPSLLFWGLGIPALAIWVLFKNRKNLDDEITFTKYSFLYEGYKYDKFYWFFINYAHFLLLLIREIMILYRKILIIVCSVFMVNSGPEIQGAFIMGVSAFNYLFQHWLEPYDQDVLNELEKRGLICSTFTMYCALFYIQDDVDSWYKLLLLVFILLLNCYFGAFWLKEFIRQKSAEMLKQPFIKKHFSCILQNKLLTKKFKKGGHNVFDFDLKRVEEAKKIMAGSNETKN